MTSQGKVLIAAPVHRILLDGLAAQGFECIGNENVTQQLAYNLLPGCVGVITSTRLQLDRELLDLAPSLKWIGRMGSGMEVIDLEYAAQRAISCFSSPEGNCNAVAEHAVGMLLSLLRNIPRAFTEVKQGIWHREENRGSELENKTIGIIGLGHTGSAFAKKLHSFDMRILAFDKHEQPFVPPYVTQCSELTEIFTEAEIISFHVPLQPDTIHYLDQNFIDNMAKPFVVINTSRGPVIDTRALYAGLQSKKISGACLDVFEQEPLPANEKLLHDTFNKILAMPNVIATPHIAGYTFEAVYKMSKVLLEKITPLYEK